MGFPSHINVSVESQNTYKNDDETNEVFQKIAVELRSHHNQKDLIQLGKDFVAFLVEMAVSYTHLTLPTILVV